MKLAVMHWAVRAAILLGICYASSANALEYAKPKPLAEGAQVPIAERKGDGNIRIAYMPPATEFNYYIAIGEGIKAAAAEASIEVFMLAPQSGADINGQMGMIQDVITQDVDAIILSTHDEAAAAPLVKQAQETYNGPITLCQDYDIYEF